MGLTDREKLEKAEKTIVGCAVAIIALVLCFLVALACAIAYGVKFRNCEEGRL